jgi:hypothetical protein
VTAPDGVERKCAEDGQAPVNWVIAIHIFMVHISTRLSSTSQCQLMIAIDLQ